MKNVWTLLLLVAMAAHSLTLDPPHCPGKVEIEDVVYLDGIDLFLDYLPKKFGAVPPGLTLRSIVKDSMLYIVGAEICFDGDESSIEIPLQVIFPEADSSWVKADSVTAQTLLVHPKGGLGTLLVKAGRIYRFYPTEDHLSEEPGFEPAHSKPLNPKDPRYQKLMERLKPYYGE